MNKKILAVVSVILAFAFLFAFAGCSSTSEEETTTTVKAKTPLPTDITTSLDEESKVVTDTTYSPENLQKNTATIFEYFNLHVNELKDIKATVKMSQKKEDNQGYRRRGQQRQDERQRVCQRRYQFA